MRYLAVLALLPLMQPCLPAQIQAPAEAQAEEYRVYTEHPRLFLRPQKLRLLKRERERDSMRWRQFDTLITGHAVLPEPGFALALHYAITGNAESGHRAVEWATGAGADVRQLALVYDWCQELLTPGQLKVVSAKLRQPLALPVPKDAPIDLQRNRVFAAIAIAELDQNVAEATLREVSEVWWNAGLAPQLNSGRNLDPGTEVQPLFEILHAIRDNLTLDLRAGSSAYFKELASYEVISNYPSPYPAAENEYRIPIYSGSGEPDLNRAALARAGGLSIVAFDTNALPSQFLQGWLIQDRFILRGTFGAPYELLWANPYQPGLSYAHLPLLLHDERSGSLFLRSSWDEDAVWFALYNGQAQLFRDGRIVVLSQTGPLAAKPEPIPIGPATVVMARPGFKGNGEGEQMFVIGWKPRAKYDVEVDDQELAEVETDAAGTLTLKFPNGQTPGIRIQEAPHGSK